MSLNNIGTKDDTLAVETSNKAIKHGVRKNNIQEKLIAIGDATNSKTDLAETTVRRIGGANTSTVAQATNDINSAEKQYLGEANSHRRCYQCKGCSGRRCCEGRRR